MARLYYALLFFMYYIQNINAKKQPNIVLIIADDLGIYLLVRNRIPENLGVGFWKRCGEMGLR